MPTRDRRCRTCGGLDEFIFELDNEIIFYCDTCKKETSSNGSELIGPEQRMQEKLGE